MLMYTHSTLVTHVQVREIKVSLEEDEVARKTQVSSVLVAVCLPFVCTVCTVCISSFQRLSPTSFTHANSACQGEKCNAGRTSEASCRLVP